MTAVQDEDVVDLEQATGGHDRGDTGSRRTGALSVLRDGIAATPELKVGFGVSLAMALVMALGRMVIPVAIQQILGHGFVDGEPRWGFIIGTGVAATVAMTGLAVLARASPTCG